MWGDDTPYARPTRIFLKPNFHNCFLADKSPCEVNLELNISEDKHKDYYSFLYKFPNTGRIFKPPMRSWPIHTILYSNSNHNISPQGSCVHLSKTHLFKKMVSIVTWPPYKGRGHGYLSLHHISHDLWLYECECDLLGLVIQLLWYCLKLVDQAGLAKEFKPWQLLPRNDKLVSLILPEYVWTWVEI